jgi:hypothetical protein
MRWCRLRAGARCATPLSAIERRLEAYIRWNAMAMVVQALCTSLGCRLASWPRVLPDAAGIYFLDRGSLLSSRSSAVAIGSISRRS